MAHTEMRTTTATMNKPPRPSSAELRAFLAAHPANPTKAAAEYWQVSDRTIRLWKAEMEPEVGGNQAEIGRPEAEVPPGNAAPSAPEIAVPDVPIFRPEIRPELPPRPVYPTSMTPAGRVEPERYRQQLARHNAESLWSSWWLVAVVCVAAIVVIVLFSGTHAGLLFQGR
jgi:hypothetical protein